MGPGRHCRHATTCYSANPGISAAFGNATESIGKAQCKRAMHSGAYFFYAAPRAGTAGKQAMPIEGIDYRLVFASDVNPRDGLGLECWRGEQPLFEVFRDDVGRRFVVNLFAATSAGTAGGDHSDGPSRTRRLPEAIRLPGRRKARLKPPRRWRSAAFDGSEGRLEGAAAARWLRSSRGVTPKKLR